MLHILNILIRTASVHGVCVSTFKSFNACYFIVGLSLKNHRYIWNLLATWSKPGLLRRPRPTLTLSFFMLREKGRIINVTVGINRPTKNIFFLQDIFSPPLPNHQKYKTSMVSIRFINHRMIILYTRFIERFCYLLI